MRLPLFTAFLLSALSSSARAQTPQVTVACTALGTEPAAAFEARAHAELAVRELAGNLSLTCTDDARLVWTPTGAPARTAILDASSLSIDGLLEAFSALLSESSASPPEGREQRAADAPTLVVPPSPTSTGQEGATPEQTEQPAEPVAGGGGTQLVPDPQKDATARVVLPLPVGSSQVAAAFRVALGVAGELWGTEPALGISAAGWLRVAPRLSLGGDALWLKGLSPPDDFSLQVVQLALGARYALHRHFALTAALSGGAANVVAPAAWALDSRRNDAACNLGEQGGSCAFIGARAGAWWTLKQRGLSPEVGFQVEATSLSLDIKRVGRSAGLLLPDVRPSVILRVAWTSPDGG